MKIPFPAFIKHIFQTPAASKSSFDTRITKPSNALATPIRESVMVHSLEMKSMGTCPKEQQSVRGAYLSTPIPQTPVFLRNNHRHVTFSKDFTPRVFTQEMRGRVAAALTTPMVVSSLDSLASGTTPADAFPDILEIIDQTWPASSYEASPFLTSNSQVCSVTDSASEIHTNELELIEMLIAIAEQVESEKNVSNKNYASTQHQDVLHSRQSGQRKCQHAKRMTEDERKYYKNTSTCKAKEKRKQKCPPALGVRRSSRAKKSVLYFY